ncbi:acyltransferase [Nibrella viscosa]|uniref:Acyltransferase n=1 Tax=Nibrella viscosa TaxID=1084524 RepID=A0ABP8KUI0_9BACT
MGKRFIVLDGFRGAFALIVALYHFKPGPGLVGKTLLIANGWFFVDFFFVLSGFVIFYNYSKMSRSEEQLSFLYKRFLRLYPLHFGILLAFLVFEILKYFLYSSGHFSNPPFQDENFVSFLANIFLVQSYGLSIPALEHLSWNTPSWSISAEFFSYIVFCFTIPIINRLKVSGQLLTFLVFSLASLVFLIIANDGSTSLKIGAHFGIFRCSYSFFLGCFACILFNEVSWYQPSTPTRNMVILFTIAEISILCLSILMVCYLPYNYSYIAPVAFFFCIFIFSFELGWLSGVLNNPFTQKLGTLSYSIYMVNALITVFFEILLLRVVKIKSPLLYDLMIIPYLTVIYLVSLVTYQYLEVKGKVVLQNWIEKTKKRLVTSTVTNNR